MCYGTFGSFQTIFSMVILRTVVGLYSVHKVQPVELPEAYAHDFLCNNATSFACVCYSVDGGLSSMPGCRSLLGAPRLSVVHLKLDVSAFALKGFGALRHYFNPALIAMLISRWCMNSTHRCIGTTLPVNSNNVVIIKLSVEPGDAKIRSTKDKSTQSLTVVDIFYTVVNPKYFVFLTPQNTMNPSIILRIMRRTIHRSPNLFQKAQLIDHRIEEVDASDLIYYDSGSENRLTRGELFTGNHFVHYQENLLFVIFLVVLAFAITTLYIIGIVKFVSNRRKEARRQRDVRLVGARFKGDGGNGMVAVNYGAMLNDTRLPRRRSSPSVLLTAAERGSISAKLTQKASSSGAKPSAQAAAATFSSLAPNQRPSTQSSRVTIVEHKLGSQMKRHDDSEEESLTGPSFGPLRVRDVDAYEITGLSHGYAEKPLNVTNRPNLEGAKFRRGQNVLTFLNKIPHKKLRKSMSAQILQLKRVGGVPVSPQRGPLSKPKLFKRSATSEDGKLSTSGRIMAFKNKISDFSRKRPPLVHIAAVVEPPSRQRPQLSSVGDLDEFSEISAEKLSGSPTLKEMDNDFLTTSMTEEYLMKSVGESDQQDETSSNSEENERPSNSSSSSIQEIPSEQDLLNPIAGYQPLSNSNWSISQATKNSRSNKDMSWPINADFSYQNDVNSEPSKW